MSGKAWDFDPHSGGNKIPPAIKERITKRILDHAEKNYAGKFTKIGVRFRGVYCYIDSFEEPPLPPQSLLDALQVSLDEFLERMRNTPHPIVRLRHFDEDRWSLAFFTYSNERYEPCVFPNGEHFGTPEQGLDAGAIYL